MAVCGRHTIFRRCVKKASSRFGYCMSACVMLACARPTIQAVVPLPLIPYKLHTKCYLQGGSVQSPCSVILKCCMVVLWKPVALKELCV